MSWLVVHFGSAALLAIAAMAVGRWTRRPALAHLLWVLVFARLLIPPLVETPVLPAEPTPVVTPAATTSVPPAPMETAVLPTVTPLPAENAAATPVVATSVVELPASRMSTSTLLLAGWALGTAAYVLWLSGCLSRFGRLLRQAEPASPDLEQRVKRLARSMNIRRTPCVRLVDRRLSPAIWSPGLKATLILPTRLLGQLSTCELDSLLVHELAHFARRDHWVRRLECMVMAVYWWAVPVWWARRQLRAVEEQCCDAWVVHMLPGHARAYADALIKTATFLSHSPARPVPPMASGAGHFRTLSRRLIMIMEQRNRQQQSPQPKRLGRFTLSHPLCGVLLVATLGLLPLMPTHAKPATEASNIAPTVYGEASWNESEANLSGVNLTPSLYNRTLDAYSVPTPPSRPSAPIALGIPNSQGLPRPSGLATTVPSSSQGDMMRAVRAAQEVAQALQTLNDARVSGEHAVADQARARLARLRATLDQALGVIVGAPPVGVAPTGMSYAPGPSGSGLRVPASPWHERPTVAGQNNEQILHRIDALAAELAELRRQLRPGMGRGNVTVPGRVASPPAAVPFPAPRPHGVGR